MLGYEEAHVDPDFAKEICMEMKLDACNAKETRANLGLDVWSTADATLSLSGNTDIFGFTYTEFHRAIQTFYLFRAFVVSFEQKRKQHGLLVNVRVNRM
jgi:hypothetical protein